MSDSLTAHGLLAISSALPPLCIVAVSLRMYARRAQSAGLKIDDWVMIPALAIYVGMGILNIYAVKVNGYGKPAPKASVTGTTGSGVGPTATVFDMMQVLMFGFTKLGALLFYRRVFCLQQPFNALSAIIIVTIAIVVMWTIAFEVVTASECGDHFWAAWSGAKNFAKYCKRTFPVLEGFAISDFLLDLIILIVPIPRIWSLHMSLARKISLTLVFMSALVFSTKSFAAAIARMVETLQVVAGKPGVQDPRLQVTRVAYWGMLEGGLGLIAVNMPSFWFLGRRVSPQSILRSVRSIISLRTLDSKTNKSSVDGVAKSDPDKPSTSSQTDLFNQNRQPAKFENYAMRDLDYENQKKAPKCITVQQGFSQVEEV